MFIQNRIARKATRWAQRVASIGRIPGNSNGTHRILHQIAHEGTYSLAKRHACLGDYPSSKLCHSNDTAISVTRLPNTLNNFKLAKNAALTFAALS